MNSFLSSADFFFFFKINFILNSLDPDQTRHFVWLDMGSDYLQWLSMDNTSRCVELMNVCIYNNQIYLQFFSHLCHNISLFQIRKLFESKYCITINVNMCFGCSKEPSH